MSSDDGVMRVDEYFPITERSFSVIIRQYEIEAAAARADAVTREEESPENSRELTLMAQYLEDLANDARRLHRKLQASGGGPVATTNWSAEDVSTLRLLGFDVSRINVAAAEEQRPQVPNLDKLLAMEREIQKLQTRVDDLTAANAELREKVAEQNCTGLQFQVEENDMSDELEALTEGLKSLKAAYLSKHGDCFAAQDMQKRSTLAFNDIYLGGHKSHKTAVEFQQYPSSGLAEAFRILRGVVACHRVRYHVTGDSSGKVDAIDMAVVRLLNDLEFPFPVTIRRLGARGDYFIDRRVEIKLVGEQLVVRPWPATGVHQGFSADRKCPPRYEHLAKYLIHLYSPALDLYRAAKGGRRDGAGVNSTEGRPNNDIAALKRQQRELQRALEDRHEQLHEYQKQLVAGLSPLANECTLRDDATGLSVELRVEERNRKVDESISDSESYPSAGTSDRVAHILRLMETNGRISDPSRLSESGLQHLKYVALQRQTHALQ
ncbi:hypothetical protein TcCL_NonESM00765 [Trypanosoma cruzi]|uniref:Uncharacterized protein n=1 Tax=Trypanosoma cruzi (strain CL Brener) TaxID=353153 RepID=Q4DP04_TRYCC|nr:hypothetical protein Tc00.1047053507519.40 [Trypanosoma cruzi]EAN94241.1 hypothetical protein Tc00.1047053507519.40 [Trypanosoma cruzi]RNC49218.1 hypothetical protein TcCL_NonESM00765 [Trypanosoma cruzi]|eukprot:XP_816092.1 hypothetical protein [Trypanosoma cruzi strain CL Brener]